MHAFDRQTYGLRTDRQTDRRTDRRTEISSLRPRLHSMQRGKNVLVSLCQHDIITLSGVYTVIHVRRAHASIYAVHDNRVNTALELINMKSIIRILMRFGY